MQRLTITLSDERHRALKERAAHRRCTIREIIDESLDLYGIKTMEDAAALVSRARKTAGLKAAKAMELATRETRAERQR